METSKEMVTMKVWQSSRQRLKVLAAQKNTTMLILLEELVTEAEALNQGENLCRQQ